MFLRVVFSSLFLLGLLLFPQSAEAFNMSVSPAMKTVELRRGESYEFTISFTNQSSSADFQIEVNDFVYDPSGGTRVVGVSELSDPSQSLTYWVTSNESISAIKGQVNKFPVKISVPQSAQYGDHYGMLVFRQKAKDGGGVVSIQGGITVLLYVKVLGGQQIKSGELASFSSVSQERARNTVNFVAEYRNTGNQFFKVMAEVEIFSAEGDQEPIAVLRKDFTSYPNVLSSVRIPLGDLGADYGERKYFAKLRIYDFTGQKKGQVLAESTHVFQYYLPYIGAAPEQHASADVPVLEKQVIVTPPLIVFLRELGIYVGGFIILLVVLIRVLFFNRPGQIARAKKRTK